MSGVSPRGEFGLINPSMLHIKPALKTLKFTQHKRVNVQRHTLPPAGQRHFNVQLDEQGCTNSILMGCHWLTVQYMG